jgi:D-alanyl-D-alanine carboxypeptidase (penicillin-binding protein 5/6)
MNVDRKAERDVLLKSIFSPAGMAFAMFLCLAGASTRAEDMQTAVPNVLLIDAGTNTVLFEKGADDRVTPASTVKILTAEIFFRELAEGRIKLTDEYFVSEYAWRNGGAPAGGSAMFLPVKSRATVDDLLRGLLVDSGNDAALVLAEGFAGSEEAFVEKMNLRAQELGLSKSHFTSPWGKDSDEQKVSARDMVKLAMHVMRAYPQYYHYFGEREFTFNKIRQLNRNPLLTMNIGADGLKTGNIGNSGFNLVGSAVEEGRRLVVAVYGAHSVKERAEEALKLLQWGFRSFEDRPLFAAGETIGAAAVYGGIKGSVDVASPVAVSTLMPRAGSEKLVGKVIYSGPVIAPVEKGAPIGRLQISRGGKIVLEQPVEAVESVAQGSLPGRTFDALFESAAGAIHQKLNARK